MQVSTLIKSSSAAVLAASSDRLADDDLIRVETCTVPCGPNRSDEAASTAADDDLISVKNISDLVLKEIHGIIKAKNPTKEQIKKYKMTERDIYEKFGNLSMEELNTKSNKNVYVKNVVMTAIIKRCRGEKKRGVRAIDGFRKKLMIPDSEITECPEFEAKSKIRK